jgi:outer membrane protein assembly factor BamB
MLKPFSKHLAVLTVGVAMLALLGTPLSGQGPRRVALGDWPELRGPNRDGISAEKGLPEKWALNGENFLWRAPYGGRSSPIVMGNRVYVQNPAGRGPALQERVMALDADTGKLVWEYKFNIFQSDVPPHRVGWASPSADPETGNVYALSVGAQVFALSKDGKLLWERSIGEEFSAFTTHGGRTASPVIDGDLVIVSAAISNYGELEARRHRFVALDKRTGDIVYVATPGGRPYDTAYAPPLIATINGQRLMIVGTGDGAVHAMKPQTGEKVWSFTAAKRAVNTGVAVAGTSVFVSHGDENFDTSELGLIAAIDGSQTGDIRTTRWARAGLQFGFSSPVLDGSRLYQIDNGSNLVAFDIEKGQELWHQQLGTVQKAAPVLGDGKLYVGTESGRFYIMRPKADGVDVLSEVELPISTDSVGGSQGTPEQILSGAAISRGRVFFVSSDAVYGFGPKTPNAVSGTAVNEPAVTAEGSPAHVQVVPTELTLKPGQTAKLRARLFDSRGRFIREEPTATWSLEGLKGTVKAGSFVAAGDTVDQAGIVKATVGSLSGGARARIVRPLPVKETFEAYADGAIPAGWINAQAGKFSVVTIDGQKALHKAPDNTLFKRIRMYMGALDLSNYTIEADIRAATRRRQMGDVGVTAQRYSLILYGTTQRLKIESWEPETERTVSMPYNWKADTWYHLKLRVENNPDGSVRARGKVWPTGEAEPQAWMIEKVDPIGSRQGASGAFVDAEFGAHIDNLTLTPNQ